MSLTNKLPEAFQELMNVYLDGDPIRMMEILMSLNELGTKTGLLTDADRSQITQFNHVLALIAQQRISICQDTIENLKSQL